MKLKENSSRPGVFVSPDGRVFVEVKAALWEFGYYGFKIPGGGTRGPISVRRHTIIAETYKGPRPFPGAQVRHLNGKHGDDRPANLKWGTAKENGLDTIRHGRSTRGERNPRYKLTEKQVREIKRRLKNESVSELAVEFGVAAPTISNIKTGDTWGWLK